MKQKKLYDYDRGNRIFAALLTTPVVLYLILIMLAPFVWAVYTSLTGTVNARTAFIGFQKYAEVLKDPLFYRAALNTVVFTAGSVLGKVIFGILMALLLNESFFGRTISRAMLILPWTIPTVISILTWKWLYSDVGGPLSYLAMNLKFTDKPVLWLSSGSIALFSIIIVNIWRGTPFIGISVLAGLQSIDGNLYESAVIDGANVFHRFLYITIPSIKDVIGMSTLVTTIWTLNDFEITWLLTRGGPASATELISTYSYKVGFLSMDLSKAMAICIIILPLLVILVNLVTKRTLRDQA